MSTHHDHAQMRHEIRDLRRRIYDLSVTCDRQSARELLKIAHYAMLAADRNLESKQ